MYWHFYSLSLIESNFNRSSLGLKFAGAEFDAGGSRFEAGSSRRGCRQDVCRLIWSSGGWNSMSTARNSRFEVRGGSELEVCSSIQSLGAAWEASTRSLPGWFEVRGLYSKLARSFAGSLRVGLEVRSIQNLGGAEEGVDAKFEVKRAEIQHRRIPKCPRESPPEWNQRQRRVRRRVVWI